MAHYSNGLIPRLDGKQLTSLDGPNQDEKAELFSNWEEKQNQIRPNSSVIHNISFCLGAFASKYLFYFTIIIH